MKLFYSDRQKKEKDFIKEVCNDILSSSIKQTAHSDEFAAVFVEGRNRKINTLEDTASIMSFKRFSKYNYPVYCFCSNPDDFLHSNKLGENFLKFHRIIIIKIPEITSLEDYTRFCIKKLYFMLPASAERIITLQPDGMLLKSGWEDWITTKKFDWVGAHWQHFAQIEIFLNDSWLLGVDFSKTCVGNGGFSFRVASKMRKVSEEFNFERLREFGREDNRIPMEDLFFTYFGFNSKIISPPTLEECNIWSRDPLTLKIWRDKDNLPFGFHFFKTISKI